MRARRLWLKPDCPAAKLGSAAEQVTARACEAGVLLPST